MREFAGGVEPMAGASGLCSEASRFEPPPRGAAVGAAVAAAVAVAESADELAFTFSEVKEFVEAASPKLLLELDASAVAGGTHAVKGRYLVARTPLKTGEVLLSEWPTFSGSMDGARSRKVFEDSFFMQEDMEDDYDCAHPCSSLVDCVSSILLARQAVASGGEGGEAEKATLRLRKLATLCRAPVEDSVPEGLAAELLSRLLPEPRALTSEDDLHRIIHTLSSNRFGGTESHLDVMFAGSMFEHSCVPNCFLGGAWRARFVDQPRQYRALRDIEVGEALSIDYLQLPCSYVPAAGRAEMLAGWGFVCACTRCMAGPEVTRAFVCPSCGFAELCPRSPSQSADLVCRACGQEPGDAYAARCLAAEAALRSCREGAPIDADTAASFEGLISVYHHAAFEVAWETWSSGPDLDLSLGIDFEVLERYTAATDQVIDCISRLYGDPLHPLLLPIYHRRAVLQQGDLEGQHRFLEVERQLLQRFYPEEADRQDSEIMHMVFGTRPPGSDESSAAGATAGGSDSSAADGQQAALEDAVGPLSGSAFEDFALNGLD